MGFYDPELDRVLGGYCCAVCPVCGRQGLKKHMQKILIGSQYGNPRVLCYLCRSCFPSILDRYEINMPE